MIIIPFIIDVLNFVKSFQITFFYIVVVVLSLLIGRKKRDQIFNAYLYLMILISIISLIYFSINLIYWQSGGIANLLTPLYRTETFSTLIYPLWSTYDLSIWHFPRNMSIFFEPGAFAFHLIISILFAIKNNMYKSLGILIITGITTFSTTMYLCLLIIFFYFVIYHKIRFKQLKYIFGILILFSVTFSKLKIDGQDWGFINLARITLVEKFIPNSASNSSHIGRLAYTTAALDIFFRSNLMGYGHYSSSYLLDFSTMEGGATTTSALFGLLAELGLFGVFCIFLYSRFFIIFGIFSIPIALIWLNGEFMTYTIFMIFILTHQGELFFINLLNKRFNFNYNKSVLV